jgi:hypothetical protein
MTATAINLNAAQVQSLVIQRLTALRAAYDGIQDLYRWTSGLAVADMVTFTGLSTADATTYLSAISDAYAESLIHLTGQPNPPAGGSYPVAPSSYVYGATQAQVIGPQ